MLNTLVVLVLLAAVLWVGWTLWQNGWDVKKAGAALVAAAAAAWLWLSESITSLTSGM
jgi:predicted negative regulator of RcsB-dependent stress response